ncbi:MAG: MATE family efflux transporter [Eubacterium sp.]|nr:MATE family efflux transporter [Eubacterium sp.]
MQNGKQEQKGNPLGSKPVGSLLVEFAVPSIIAMLVSALYNIVDQFFIGHYVGMLGNAATNVAFPLTMSCTAISLMCGIGGAANFNLNMGRGRKEKAAKYAGNAVTMTIVIGVLLCVVTKLFLKPMMVTFGATDQTLAYSLTYTGITSFGFPFLIFTTGGSNLVRADGSPRFSMLCTLVGAIVNTVLDALFMIQFGMGIQGAAWATVIGQVVSAVLVAAYLSRFQTVKLVRECFLPKAACWGNIARLGMSPCINQLAMMAVQIVLNNVLTFYGAQSAYGGDIPLACAGIISKVGMMFFSIVIGISQGMQPIVSFNYGAKQYGRVLEAVWKSIFCATVISLVAFLCFQIFPRQIIGLFGQESEEYFAFAERYFRIYMFFTFVNQFQPIVANMYTSIGKAAAGALMSLTRQILFLMPLLIVLPKFFGLEGAMYAAPIADFVAFVIALAMLLRESRLLKRAAADVGGAA